MSDENSLDGYVASAHYWRFYRERLDRLGIRFFTYMKPTRGGISDACDSMNTALFTAFKNGESPTSSARSLFQRWIDSDIPSSDVIVQLREPGDIQIFKDAENMWLDLGGSYHD